MWDIATILNAELRELAGGGREGDPDRGAGDPQLRRVRRRPRTRSTSSSTSSTTRSRASTTSSSGSTRAGATPARSTASIPQISYEPSVDIYLNRLKGDVWTIESKDERPQPAARVRAVQGQAAEEGRGRHHQPPAPPGRVARGVAADIRRALEFIDAGASSCSPRDCGFGRQGVPRPIAMYKAAALAQGANIVRGELGAEQTESAPPTRRCRSTSLPARPQPSAGNPRAQPVDD